MNLFQQPKVQKSWVETDQPSTSQSVRNIHGKTYLLCIWWDIKGALYYTLLIANEKIIGNRFWQQLIKLILTLDEKWLEYDQKHDKIIFQHDNVRVYVVKHIKKTV